jgi:hypothetical protein
MNVGNIFYEATISYKVRLSMRQGYSKQNGGHEGEEVARVGVDGSAQAFGGLLKRSRRRW